jgi:sugar phosphate isomerase/epimerase
MTRGSGEAEDVGAADVRAAQRPRAGEEGVGGWGLDTMQLAADSDTGNAALRPTAPPLGIASHSVPGIEGRAILEQVKALGLDGVDFMNPLQVSPTLDVGELSAARACADNLGIYISVGLGRISPFHFTQRPEVLALGDGDFVQGLARMIRALAAIGCAEQFFWTGSPADRVSRSVPWVEQIAAVRNFLEMLAPLLRDLGCHLNLKTHGENPTREIVGMVEAVGPDVLGIAFDPANVFESLEDPVAAARRVAPYVRQVQADDALLRFTEDGLERVLRPCGAGILDWPAMLAILRDEAPAFTLNVELHRAEARMPIFDPEWLAFQTDVTVPELAETIRLARFSEPRLAALASDNDRGARLAPSIAYLRRLLTDTYGMN